MSLINIVNSEKKQKLIMAALNSELTIGEKITVPNPNVYSRIKTVTATIVEKVNSFLIKVTLENDNAKNKTIYDIDLNKDSITRHDVIGYAGANPIKYDNRKVEYISYAFESILYKTGFEADLKPDNDKSVYFADEANTKRIFEFNWNPYIYDKNGIKKYFQRDFVWSLEDNQLLIESIYNGIECGRILVRKHSFESIIEKSRNGETELFFHDIVDGKQRLNAMFKFLRNEFSDLQGNYFSDLSNNAQRRFVNHHLFSYAELDDNVSDKEVIQQFLKVNFTGRVMSKEHIEYVKSLNI